MNNKFFTLRIILLMVLNIFLGQLAFAQPSCPEVVGVIADALPVDGTSNCTFTIHVEWVKQSLNNASLQLVLLVDGDDGFDDGVNCDISSITVATGLPQTFTFPNSIVADCNAEISVMWTAKSNPSCNGGSSCGTGTEIAFVSLPVELVYFETAIERASVRLDWHTLSEENNDHFVIEHSGDGRYFQEIGQVKGHGTVSEPIFYRFIDKSPLKGTNYYRLKQVDYNNAYEYSEVKVVEYESGVKQLKLMPTVVEDEIRVVFYSHFLRETPIEIFDALGHVMLTQQLKLGENEMVVDVSNFKAGQYFIRIRGERSFIIERFIKLE